MEELKYTDNDLLCYLTDLRYGIFNGETNYWNGQYYYYNEFKNYVAPWKL